MAKKIGVLLSGCGYLDGAEIHEATLTLYFLDKAGAEIICMAPDKDQMDVMDHNKKEPCGEPRNVMREAGRISRGNMKDVAQVSADELDALVIPGGFGAAKNLCTFAVDGPDCTVDPGVEKLVKAMHGAGKPIGALCIAPALVAKILGDGVQVTIGNDKGTAEAIAKTGAVHQDQVVEDIVVDEAKKVVTTPCYMLGPGPAAVGAGIDKLVTKLLSWL